MNTGRKWILGFIICGIGLVLAFFPILAPSMYFLHILNLSLIYVIGTLGFNYIFGWAGQLAFGHAGFFAIGAYSVGLLSAKAGLDFWSSLVMAMIIAGIFGIIIGFPSLRLRGNYLSLATLGFAEIVRVVINNWVSFTGGPQGVKAIPGPPLIFMKIHGENQFYYVILALTALAIWFTYKFRDSKYGQALRALRSGDTVAASVGINVVRYKLLAFVLSSVFAGLAGGIYASWAGYISPDTYEFSMTISFVGMLVVGGNGSILGSVLGPLILTPLPEYLRFIKEYYLFCYGVGIILAVLFMPYGINGILVSVYRKWKLYRTRSVAR
jgi:branched-chain amino acid transport system permease protein